MKDTYARGQKHYAMPLIPMDSCDALQRIPLEFLTWHPC